MNSLTPAQAIEDINTMFFEAVRPLGFVVHWEAVPTDRQPTNDPYFTFITRHAAGGRPTLGGKGHRSFLRIGTLIASVFIPVGKGLSESYPLVKTMVDAYEGESSPNGVWFRDVRIQEIGRDGEFFRTNVLAEFEYHEIK